jgi:hypothetical protein
MPFWNQMGQLQAKNQVLKGSCGLLTNGPKVKYMPYPTQPSVQASAPANPTGESLYHVQGNPLSLAEIPVGLKNL